MICRLCLKNLIFKYAISIFQSNSKPGLSAVITQYLQLEICADDSISVSICQDCYNHLEDFHRFWTLIDSKQKTLKSNQKLDQCYEFLEVKCEGNFSVVDEKVSIEEDLLNLNENNNTENILKIKTEDTSYSSEDETPLNLLCNMPNEEFRKRKKQVIACNNKKETEKNSTLINSVLTDIELSCEICKIQIGNYDDLHGHFSLKHNNETVFVKCCGKIYKGKKPIGHHLSRHRDPEKFRCYICRKLLASTKYLKKHIRYVHQTEKANISFKCITCLRIFKSKVCLEKHIKRHSSEVDKEEVIFNCDNCKRSFTSLCRWKRHCQIMHQAIYPYKCEACGENFLSKQDLENHNPVCKNRNLLLKGQTEMELSSDEMICKFCCKIFPNVTRLRAHTKSVHENVHQFICDQCGQKFKLKSSFDNHLRTHNGNIDPPVQCETCGKWSKNKNTLRLHKYSHDNSYNKCTLCDHVSTTRHALRCHVKKKHRLERDYQCKYCEKSFKDPKSQQEHIATHTGAHLYSCPHCPRETRSSANMYAHIKRMHAEEWLKSKLARSNDPNAKAELEKL